VSQRNQTALCNKLIGPRATTFTSDDLTLEALMAADLSFMENGGYFDYDGEVPIAVVNVAKMAEAGGAPELPYTVPAGTPCISKVDPSTPPPRTQNQAKKSPYWEHFKAAEALEVKTLKAKGCWKLIASRDRTPGAKVLRGKWVYSWKKNPKTGVIARAKARYTAMGNFQQYGIDFDQTTASVMRPCTFRWCLQLANLDPTFVMEEWDFTAAYVNAELEEPVFCIQPPGHEDPTGPQLICQLLRALYGLKQSGRMWQRYLRELMAVMDAKPLDTDPATFFLSDGVGWMLMPTHVDDCFPVYNPAGKALRDRIFDHISSLVEVTCSGEIRSALKCRIHRDKAAGITKMSQEAFTWEMLTRFEALTCKQYLSPGDCNKPLPNPDDVTDKMMEAAKSLPIREALGCLSWLAQMSRPDICASVYMAAGIQHKPCKELWLWIMHIFGYLRRTAHLGLIMRRPAGVADVRMMDCFADVSFAPDINVNKAKSRIGIVTRFFEAPVMWSTQLSSRPLSSSSEAECAGLHEAVKEVRWQRDFLNEVGLFPPNGPTIIWEDNTSSITLSGAKTFHKRSRHFGIEWYSVKHDVEKAVVEPLYIPTCDQLADILTKVLPGPQHRILRDALMGEELDQLFFGTLHPPGGDVSPRSD
jgi:histone deacetylase 1/2